MDYFSQGGLKFQQVDFQTVEAWTESNGCRESRKSKMYGMLWKMASSNVKYSLYGRNKAYKTTTVLPWIPKYSFNTVVFSLQL